MNTPLHDVRRLLVAAQGANLPPQSLRRVVAACTQHLGQAAAANATDTARPRPEADPVDAIAERRAAELGAAYAGAMAPFREAILASNSAEDAIARVQAAYADWQPGRVSRLVEEALQISAAAGAANLPLNPGVKRSKDRRVVAANEYDENQPRDDAGKWTSGATGHSAASPSAALPTTISAQWSAAGFKDEAEYRKAASDAEMPVRSANRYWIDAHARGTEAGRRYDSERDYWGAVNAGSEDAPDLQVFEEYAFFSEGFRGQPVPPFSTGWRYGEVEKGQEFSTNFRDQQPEAGISTISIDGLGNTSDNTYEAFASGGKKLHRVSGFLISKKGSDGEPLLVAARTKPADERLYRLSQLAARPTDNRR